MPDVDLTTQIGADGTRHEIDVIDQWQNPDPYRVQTFTVKGTKQTGQVPVGPVAGKRYYVWGTGGGGVELPDHLFVQDDEPDDPENGDIWVTATTLDVSEWDGDSWEPLDGAGYPDWLYVQDNDPGGTPNENDVWIQPGTHQTWVYLSGQWTQTGVVVQGVFVQDEQPVAGVAINDIWINRSGEDTDTAPAVKRFNGLVWAPYYYSDVVVPPGLSPYFYEVINEGPYGLWPLDDSPPSGANSLNEYYPTGIINGHYTTTGVTRVVGPVAGTYATQYNGTTGMGRIDQSAWNAASSDQLSIEAWVWLDSYTNDQSHVLFELGSSVANGNLLVLPAATTGKLQVQLGTSTVPEIVDIDRPAVNTWFFLSLVVDRTAPAGSQISIKINNSAATTNVVQAANATGPFNTNHLNLMARASGGGSIQNQQLFQAGKLYGLAIYPVALSDARRTIHYNSALV